MNIIKVFFSEIALHNCTCFLDLTSVLQNLGEKLSIEETEVCIYIYPCNKSNTMPVCLESICLSIYLSRTLKLNTSPKF